MPESQVELSGHDNGVTWELVVKCCALRVFVGIRDRQQGAASVRQRSDRISAVVSFREVLMWVDAILSLQGVPVENEVIGFLVVADLIFVPVLLCGFELRNENLCHFRCEFIRLRACLQLSLVAVAAEKHSAGALVRCYLH